MHCGKQLLANASGAPGSAKRSVIAGHDRAKPRLLDPSDPFLVRVGVSAADGRSVRANRRDKYKQVEEFLKLLDSRSTRRAREGTSPSPLERGRRTWRTWGAGTRTSPSARTPTSPPRGRTAPNQSSTKTRSRMKIPMEVLGVDVKAQARETRARRRRARVGSKLRVRRGDHRRRGRGRALADAPRRRTIGRRRRRNEGGVGGRGVGAARVRHGDGRGSRSGRALARAADAREPVLPPRPAGAHAAIAPGSAPADDSARILRERLGDVVTDAFRAHVMRLLGHRVDVTEWIGGSTRRGTR